MTWKSQRHFSEEAFLQATFREFVKCWGSGKRARIFVESVNGGAFVSFSTFLGNPGTPHIDPRKAARTCGHPEGHHDSNQNGGNPHFQPAFKKKSKRKTERDNARAAEFQKKKKEEAEQEAAGGKEKTSRKDEEEIKAASEEEFEESKESEMTISSLDSSPGSRKFIFASPVQETLRQNTSLDISMIIDDEKDKTRQDETEVHNDWQNDNVDEDEVDSFSEYRDNLEGSREENNDNYGDVEEEPGKDMIPEPPPQPPLYRPPRPPIKLSFLGTTSFERRTLVRSGLFRTDVFRYRQLWIHGKIVELSSIDWRKIIELKNRF